MAQRWLAEAEERVATNPWAMALATVSSQGRPSVRYVLLKALSETEQFVVFYTNYASRKAGELEQTGFAAAALYWPDVGRQLRFEGRIERSPAAESDAYFGSRPRASQLNAWASAQSRSIESPEAMAARLLARESEFAHRSDIPRPAGWGGYRLYLDAVEFWVAGADRFHERLSYRRGPATDWTAGWLQP